MCFLGHIAGCGLALLLISASAQEIPDPQSIRLTVVDETDAPVAGAIAIIKAQGSAPIQVSTDYAGEASSTLQIRVPFHVHIQKPGFYPSDLDETDPALSDIHLVLTHQQMVMQSVDVVAEPDGIDPHQVSDKRTMHLPEIVNVPFPTSRDIRNLLPYFPGVIQQGANGPVHLAGSEAWAILDTLDGFDVRSPFDGMLSMRFSADAVRSIDKEATRYPVEYGRNTGGVIAFTTSSGDNHFRFNVTDVVPQFEEVNGFRFDKYVPRLSFSGPIQRDHAWFFDAVETELDEMYVPQLPSNQDTNVITRGSNLFRIQWNASPQSIIRTGLLFNDYHTPYFGLSPSSPQLSTTNRDTIAWFPYTRLQQHLGSALLEAGVGLVRFSDGERPYRGGLYTIGPNTAGGEYFEKVDNVSQNLESNAMLYLPPHRWLGRHDLKAGIDVDQIEFRETVNRSPVRYLRADGKLLRQSTFPATPPFARHNLAAGTYLEDHWAAGKRWIIEPGLRFDWDEIVRKPSWAPRLAIAVMPGHSNGNTKLGGGIGIYYEHTQLEYLERSLAGVREDTYYDGNGLTPISSPLWTTFTYDQRNLKQPYAINWSVGLEQRLPGKVDVKANFIQRRVFNGFVYADRSAPEALAGNFVLTNNRQETGSEFEVEARHTFRGDYTLYAAYTRSSARTNAVIDYVPTISYLGPQQGGPLPWDSPNHVVSWGWVPLLIPGMRKNWNFVYSFTWRTGFPYSILDANHQVVGPANGYRYPDYLELDPGLEWKFHLHNSNVALRAVVENATGAANPYWVNNILGARGFGKFSTPAGRSFSVRLRFLDGGKHKMGFLH